MEGVTKWDYINSSTLNEAEDFQTPRLNRSTKNVDDNRTETNNCSCSNCEKTHTKLLHAKLVNDFEKEKKAREFLEFMCIQQAEEMKANRDEIVKLRSLCKGIQREAAEDRKMLQVAEAWREERAQMKLGDAKLMLEEKYSQLNDLITLVRNFLPSSHSNKSV